MGMDLLYDDGSRTIDGERDRAGDQDAVSYRLVSRIEPDDRARRHATMTRRPLLALLLLALAACNSQPTVQPHRPLSAPFASLQKVAAQWFAPSAIAADARQMFAGTGRLLADEADVGTARRTLLRLGEEPERLRDLADDTGALLASEAARPGHLPESQGLAALDPRPDCADLAADLHRLPHTLQLDRRALGEPDDVQHRTDPDDDHPEASWSARLLRRILP